MLWGTGRDSAAASREGEAAAVPSDLSRLPGDSRGPERSGHKTLESHPFSWGAAARSHPLLKCYPVPRQSGAARRVRCRSNVSLPAAGMERPISARRKPERAGAERGGRGERRALPDWEGLTRRLAAKAGGHSQEQSLQRQKTVFASPRKRLPRRSARDWSGLCARHKMAAEAVALRGCCLPAALPVRAPGCHYPGVSSRRPGQDTVSLRIK